MKLSENIKRIRKENNLSQEQLAEKLGVSRQAVSKWESGQSYPEMDKVLTICNLFGYNMDELMNENIKEVNDTKQSKINLNKYVDDFFAFITKTVDMFSSMTFKQKIKCLVEQVAYGIVLVCILAIIGSIGSEIVSGLLGGFPSSVYHAIRGVLNSIYILLACILGMTILLHIFKIRYLDYYEIVKENPSAEADQETDTSFVENAHRSKTFLEKKKEKIIIRNPEHAQSKFLTGIVKMVVWCMKVMAIFVATWLAFAFVSLIALMVLSFLFFKTGLVFWGVLLGIISALIIHFILLLIVYNFIVSKKNPKTKIAISFIISFVLAGISIGMILIGITQFHVVDAPTADAQVEDSYSIEMTENLFVHGWDEDIEYIETDTAEVKIVIQHSKYDTTTLRNRNGGLLVICSQSMANFMDAMRDIINDLNHKELKNYYQDPKISVYTSAENIQKMKQNKLEY